MPRTKAIAIQNLRKAQQKSAVEKQKTLDGGKAEKKTRRWRPGTVAQREIRKYQKSTKNVLPRTRVKNLVKAMLHKFSKGGDARMTKNAFESIYEMTASVATDALKAAERVRAAENKVESIDSRHLRIGRGLIGVHCLSDSQIPLEFSLRPRDKSSRKHEHDKESKSSIKSESKQTENKDENVTSD